MIYSALEASTDPVACYLYFTLIIPLIFCGYLDFKRNFKWIYVQICLLRMGVIMS